MKKHILLFSLMILFSSFSQARPFPYGGPLYDARTYFREFLHPSYYGHQLSWCNEPGKICGKAVADNYCQMMGYLRADRFRIAYDVGLTRYMGTNRLCGHYSCDGFQSISCLQRHDRNPPAPYHYRRYTFNYPRYDHHRIAWCYSDKGQCGRVAAHSYCRQVGYAKAIDYKKAIVSGITQRLGSKQLCIGSKCSAFKQITCYR